MKLLFFLTCLSITIIVEGQNIIDWDGKYQLQLSDFQSPTTKIGVGNTYSLYSGSVMDFSFYMSNAEFMFTKNFNSKVSCSFKRDVASLVAPDSLIALSLLHFSHYEFDLSELQARKLRKMLYESKGAFSNVGFFKPIYDQIQKEFVERQVAAGTQTDLGRNEEKLKELHQEVLKEIESLPDFCKTCKPQKKRK